MTSHPPAIATDGIREQILRVRGHKVILDSDLAALYGVETRRLNEQVRRNRERFPEDFLLELDAVEFAHLKSQIATSSWGGRRKLPFAFTEHGAIMAASVLNSPRAIDMSIHVVRAFVRLRDAIASNQELARKLDELDRRMERKLATHDQAIVGLLKAIRELMTPAESPKRPIGFVHPQAEKSRGKR